MGTAQNFAVLGSSTVTNTGPTVITGDLGVDPGTAVTGFPPGTVVAGTIHAADAVALQAQSDTTTAYNNLAGQACTTTFGVPTDLVGQTLVPGVYCFSSSGSLTGALTLNAQGNPSAVWVFKTGSTFITGSNASVVLINGAQQCNVFWQIGSSATIGTSTTFVGNILALTSISLTTNATLAGRALARNGAVTLDSNIVSITACAVPPVTPIPPTVGKAFSPTTINAGGNSTLTITLSNADATDATLTAPLIDTLPSGVLIDGSSNTTCSGGTLTAVTGSSTVTLGTGAVIPHTGSCTVTVPVTAADGGSYINSIAAASLKTSNGNNAAPAVATLTVIAPTVITPTVGKNFNPAAINAGDNSTLTITLSNADATNATLTASLVDILPTGVVIAGSGAATTCVGGTLTAPDGGSTVTLGIGAVIPNGSSCTITVSVNAPSQGSYINSLIIGALHTNNGNNAAPAVATLTVAPVSVGGSAAPTLSKAFDPATINAPGNSTLTITLINAGTTVSTLSAALIDTLPSGVVIAGAATKTCVGGTLTAVLGSSTVTLGASAVIPIGSSCTITVPVSASSGGNYINSIAAGALQTNNGNNAAPAIATLTVISPTSVTLGKTFGPATISAGGNSTLTITLSNVGPIATLSAPLTDTLPSGVVIAGAATKTCVGGTLTAVLGSSTVTLAGGSIPANASCTVTVPVTAPDAGSFFNSLPAGALQTNNGNNGAPAIATLTVVPVISGPSLSKSFSPSTISPGGVSTLTITLTNPNNTIAKLTAALSDYLPSGVKVVGSVSSTCIAPLSGFNMHRSFGQPRLQTVAFRIPAKLRAWLTSGTSMVSMTGGSIPANGSCTVTVNVTAKNGGSYINTLPAGALQTNLGSNTLAASATLIVTSTSTTAPTLSKSFSPATIKTGGVSVLTITLNNPNGSVATLTSPLTDNLPSGVVIASTPNASTTCFGGTLTATQGSTKVILGTGASIPSNGSCTITVNVTADYQTCISSQTASSSWTSYGGQTTPAIATNTLPVGALQTSNGSNTSKAVATLTVTGSSVPPTGVAVLAASPTSINFGNVKRGWKSAPGPITISNTGTATLKNLAIYDPDQTHFPGTSGTCGTTLAAGSSCTITGNFLPGKTLGLITTTLTISSSNGGTITVSLSGTGI